MLTLTRRPGERILIGDDIVIEVASIYGNQASIKIIAPLALPILREEIFLKMQRKGITSVTHISPKNVDSQQGLVH